MESRLTDTVNTPPRPARRKRAATWLKRLGIAGFLFFLVKGLAWLFFGAAIVRYLGCKD